MQSLFEKYAREVLVVTNFRRIEVTTYPTNPKTMSSIRFWDVDFFTDVLFPLNSQFPTTLLGRFYASISETFTWNLSLFLNFTSSFEPRLHRQGVVGTIVDWLQQTVHSSF